MRGRLPSVLRASPLRLRCRHFCVALQRAADAHTPSPPSISSQERSSAQQRLGGAHNDYKHSSVSSSRTERAKVPLRIGRCPKSNKPLSSYKCPLCPKEFALERALRIHEASHRTHAYECDVCHRRSTTEASLRAHQLTHKPRDFFLCLTCGDEFRSKQLLQTHHNLHPGDHVSKRQHILFSSSDEVNEAFRFPVPLNGGVLVHTTDRRSANKILASGKLSASRANRVHDGLARRSDCPELTFFSTEEVVYPVSPHPVHAEPGELCTSLLLPLDKFARHRGEYKLFVVACVPSSGHVFDNAQLRVTVMLCRAQHWAWCRDHNLLELDMYSNRLLRAASSDSDSGGGVRWEVATHFFSDRHGWRHVRLVVAAASDTMELDADLCAEQIQCVDTMHMFQDDDGTHCGSCLQTFPHPMNVYAHLDDTSFACSDTTCSEVFTTRHNRRLHEVYVHGDTPMYACSFDGCSMSFKHKREFDEHQERHQDQRAYACGHSSCTAKFNTRRDLRSHEAHIHSSSRRFPCPVDDCNSVFKTWSNLKSHERRHAAPSIPCIEEGCDKMFKTEAERRLHAQHVHSDERSFACSASGCSKLFKSSSSLRKHERTHIAEEHSAHACAICSRSFTLLPSLRRHMRTQHSVPTM